MAEGGAVDQQSNLGSTISPRLARFDRVIAWQIAGRSPRGRGSLAARATVDLAARDE